MREWVSIAISLTALIISGISFYHNRAHQLIDFKYKLDKDKETFLMSLKSDLNSLSLELQEIKINQEKIDITKKDKYTFYLDKYTKESTEKCLDSYLVKEWSNLKISIDETLNLVIFKNDYSSIYKSTVKLRNFIKSF